MIYKLPKLKLFSVVILFCLCSSNAHAIVLADVFDEPVMMYDRIGDVLSKQRIEQYEKSYEILRASRVLKGYPSCQLYGQRWPCARHDIFSLLTPVGMSDAIEQARLSHSRSSLKKLSSTPSQKPDEGGFFDYLLKEPLPPPIPFLAFATDQIKKTRPIYRKETPEERFSHVTNQAPLIGQFDPSTAKNSLRDFYWSELEDFTSFAPQEAIFAGDEVREIIEQLAASDYRDSACRGICGIVRKKTIKGIEQYRWCAFKRYEGFVSPPIFCSVLAFRHREHFWLRTRIFAQVGDGRGAGAEETFLCTSDLSKSEALNRLRVFFLAQGYRVRTSAKEPKLIASAFGLVSEVALNRYELVYFTAEIEDGSGLGPGARSAVRYLIPTYKLSATKTEIIGNGLDPLPISSFDEGITPNDKVVRAFEKTLRMKMEKILGKSVCNDKPDDL